MIFPTEKQFQAAAFRCLNNEYHQFRGLVWHTKNEGEKNDVIAMQDKAQGLRAGVPDLAVMLNGITYFCELKNEGGRLTTAQKEFHAHWLAYNPVWVAYPDGSDGLLQVRQWGDRIIKNNWKIDLH